MKTLIWIVVAILVGGYFVNDHLENKAQQEAARAKTERIDQAIKLAVAKLASRNTAVDDWEKVLSDGHGVRFEPILTVELEKLWLTARPILFVGAIKDIATYNEENYTLRIERSIFTKQTVLSNFGFIFGAELELSLHSPKNKIDSFLKKHPTLFKNLGFNNGVAVVAQIRSVRTAYFSGENGEREEVKIGEGELLEILYTGNPQF